MCGEEFRGSVVLVGMGLRITLVDERQVAMAGHVKIVIPCGSDE